MPLPTPVRVSGVQTQATRFSNFDSSGSGSRFDETIFSCLKIRFVNDSGAQRTFTVQQGDGGGGWETVAEIDVPNGTYDELTWSVPGFSPTNARMQITVDTTTTGYSAEVQYIHLLAIQYNV